MGKKKEPENEAPTPKRHKKGQHLSPIEKLMRIRRIQELSVEMTRPGKIVDTVMVEWGISRHTALGEYTDAMNAWVSENMDGEALESRRQIALERLVRLYQATDDGHVKLGVLKEMNKVGGLYHPLAINVKNHAADESGQADRARLVELMNKHRFLIDNKSPEDDPN